MFSVQYHLKATYIKHARKEDLKTEDFKQDFAFDELNGIDWLAHIGCCYGIMEQ